MAKKLDFKDFLTVDYMPGMDPIIKRNAKKRKMDSGAGSNAEYSSTYAPDEHVDTIDEANAQNKNKKRNYLGKLGADANDKIRGSKKLYPGQAAAVKLGRELTKEEAELDEALNAQQRRQRSIQMKRNVHKLELGREREARKFADKDRLMTRARRQARTRLFMKLTKGIAKSELTYQRRQEIEKRLDSPNMKKAINRIAIKLLPKERQAEILRHRSGGNTNK